MGWEHEPSEADTVWLQGIELQSGGEAGGQICVALSVISTHCKHPSRPWTSHLATYDSLYLIYFVQLPTTTMTGGQSAVHINAAGA